MNEVFSIILLIEIVCFYPALVRPGLLKQQRYEFQEYHTIALNDHISSPQIARLDVAPDPVSEFANYETMLDTHSTQVYNQGTGDYESVPLGAALDVSTPEKLESGIIHNRNMHHSSNIEIHTPISVETPKHQVNASSHKQLQIQENEFYGSTYDQQPIFDLQFVNRVLSTARPSMVNVMPLVRNKNNVKISTTTTSTPSTTTVVTTTEQPTTETNIMSMLPNKKLSINYTDVYHKVRAELDSQMKQISDNASKETHFMGMTSNTDHVKLSYETIVDGTDHKNNRGDQPSNSDNNIFGDNVEPEPGVGYYSVNREPVVPKSSTPSHISSTTKQNQSFRNQLFTAPLAPFPTMTKQSSNPYYSAPLAPFPDNVQQLTAQTQIEHSELSDESQETQVPTEFNATESILVKEDEGTGTELNELQYDEDILDNSQFQISNDMQKYDNVQQRYLDIAGGHHIDSQMDEKELPRGNTFQYVKSQHTVGGFSYNSDNPVNMITETPTPVGNKPQMNNWFQQQFYKLKHAF